MKIPRRIVFSGLSIAAGAALVTVGMRDAPSPAQLVLATGLFAPVRSADRRTLTFCSATSAPAASIPVEPAPGGQPPAPSPLDPFPSSSSSPSPRKSRTRYRDKIFSAASIIKTPRITYNQGKDEYGDYSLRMEIYRPPASDTVTSRPFILWLAGGNFSSYVGNMAAYAREFAQRGYVGVVAEYRLTNKRSPSTQSLKAAQTGQVDANAAIQYLKDHASDYRLDVGKAIVGGFSAGGIISAWVGYKYDDIGLSAAPVVGIVLLDGRNIEPSDFRVGDRPFILIRNSAKSRDDPGDVHLKALLAQAKALGIVHQVSVIPKTVHFKLGETRYVPSISAIVAQFLYEKVLGEE